MVIQRMILGAGLIVATLFFAALVHAKRVARPVPPPVDTGTVKYVVVPWAVHSGLTHNGGYIEARDSKSDTKLWGITVYHVEYAPELEKDVQDVFITSLTLDADKNRLVVVNEAGHTYWFNLDSRTVTHLLAKRPKAPQ